MYIYVPSKRRCARRFGLDEWAILRGIDGYQTSENEDNVGTRTSRTKPKNRLNGRHENDSVSRRHIGGDPGCRSRTRTRHEEWRSVDSVDRRRKVRRLRRTTSYLLCVIVDNTSDFLSRRYGLFRVFRNRRKRCIALSSSHVAQLEIDGKVLSLAHVR